MTVPSARRIGFVSTRLQGTDGVSLEAAKWATTLERAGHRCFYFAGDLDRPADRSWSAPEASLRHPDIVAMNGEVFAPGPAILGRLDERDTCPATRLLLAVCPPTRDLASDRRARPSPLPGTRGLLPRVRP